MKILALNSGSSSIKYRFFEFPGGERLASGRVEPIGVRENHRRSFEKILSELRDAGAKPDAVGHRVVHGGELFREAVKVDDRTLEEIRSLSPLARLHNPINVTGIEVARRSFPGAEQVAVFDTAFHRTLPERAYTYALPPSARSLGNFRRFGFHGISYSFVSRRAAMFLGRAAEATNLIVLHLGNGSSVAAVQGGQSIDTSMGMTPLEGLVMGTRPGDLDPGIPLRLARESGETIEEVERQLEEESGLRGLAGSSDLREIVGREEAGDAAARLAIDLYAYRIKKYVGAYFAALGRVDAVVFTGGVGENSPEIRARSLAGMKGFGILIDEAANRADSRDERAIGDAEAAVAVLVIPTNEEIEIATQTLACLERGRAPA